MVTRRSRYKLSFVQWIFIHWAGLVLGSLAMFILYSTLRLTLYTTFDQWFQLCVRLMICGAAQGAVFGSAQAIALLSSKLVKRRAIAQTLVSTIGSMALGMALPVTYARLFLLSKDTPIDSGAGYQLLGWLLSWVLAGLLWGAIVGRTTAQKITFGLLNAIAYFWWGLAAFVGLMFFAAVLDNPNISSPERMIASAIVVAILILGAVFNGVIFRMMWRGRQSVEGTGTE
jgi:hypothetical protein